MSVSTATRTPSLLEALPHARRTNGDGDPVPDSDHAREIYLAIDKLARTVGERMRATHPPVDELRERSERYAREGLAWLSGINADLARTLERDVRLAAWPVLYAGSIGDGSGGLNIYWLNQYWHLLDAHVSMLAAERAQ